MVSRISIKNTSLSRTSKSSTSTEIKIVDSKSADIKIVDSTSIDSTSIDSKSLDSTSSDSKSLDSTRIDIKSVDTTRIGSKSIDSTIVLNEKKEKMDNTLTAVDSVIGSSRDVNNAKNNNQAVTDVEVVNTTVIDKNEKNTDAKVLKNTNIKDIKVHINGTLSLKNDIKDKKDEICDINMSKLINRDVTLDSTSEKDVKGALKKVKKDDNKILTNGKNKITVIKFADKKKENGPVQNDKDSDEEKMGKEESKLERAQEYNSDKIHQILKTTKTSSLSNDEYNAKIYPILNIDSVSKMAAAPPPAVRITRPPPPKARPPPPPILF